MTTTNLPVGGTITKIKTNDTQIPSRNTTQENRDNALTQAINPSSRLPQPDSSSRGYISGALELASRISGRPIKTSPADTQKATIFGATLSLATRIEKSQCDEMSK